MSTQLELGLSMAVIGAAIMLLVWGWMRLAPMLQPPPRRVQASLRSPSAVVAAEGILVVRPGGRLESLNTAARSFFDLDDGERSDLEHLARRVRVPEAFYEVCAAPGQTSLSIGNRVLRASSHEVVAAEPFMLVSLHDLDALPQVASGAVEATGPALKLIEEFSVAVAAAIDVEETVYSILAGVDQIVHADVLEVKLINLGGQSVTTYGPEPTQDGNHQVIPIARSPFGKLTERIIASRVPLLLEDTRLDPEYALAGDALAITSYVGVPLMAGDDLVGVLEVGQQAGGNLGKRDLDVLQLIAAQAAFALRNARAYELAQKRASELSSFADLHEMMATTGDHPDLAARLVESLGALFDADVIGLLLYDVDDRILRAQSPFRGVPPRLVEIFQAAIPAGSPAEHVFRSGQSVVSVDASTDERWRTLGLIDIAVAASFRDMALVPLQSQDQTIGYLQIGHQRSGASPFTEDDQRLMRAVAEKVTAIVENSRLANRVRFEAQRGQALARIAELTASSLSLGDILHASIEVLVGAFQAEAGLLRLLDERQGALVLVPASCVGIAEGAQGTIAQLSVHEPAFGSTVTATQRALSSGRLAMDRHVPEHYRQLAQALHLEKAAVIPLVVHQRSLGELVLGGNQDLQLSTAAMEALATAGHQLATAVELAAALDRTDQDLREHLDRLLSETRLDRIFRTSNDLRQVLEVLHDEAVRIARAACGYIMVFEPGSDAAAPTIELALGCIATPELSALERRALQTGAHVLAADLERQGQAPAHAGVRSAVIVPLTHAGRNLGIMHLHSERAGYFNAEVGKTLDILAAQAGAAIVSLHAERDERQREEVLRRRAETLVKLADVSHALSAEQPTEAALQAIADGIRESTPFRVVLISLYEPETELLRRVAGAGISEPTLAELLARKQPWEGLRKLMLPQFKIGRAFFIPADQTPVLPAEVHYVYSTYDAQSSGGPAEAWDPDDFLLFPLFDAAGDPLGLISVDDPENGLRPDRATIESIDVFASQAALVISSSRRAAILQDRLEALSLGMDRQPKLTSVGQTDLPVLLRKDLEQTISLHSLDRRVQRVRAGLAISEAVSRQLDSSSALLALGRETLTHTGMSTALVAENAVDGPRLLYVLGGTPPSVNVEALFGQRNPLRASLQSGEPILISSLDEDEQWRDAPLLAALRAKGVVCLPVNVEGEPVAAMLAVSQEAMPPLTDEDRQVYLQISRQASVILQNISLLSEARRRLKEVNLLLEFSQLLTGLGPQEIVTALLENTRRVLRTAHAGAVLLWDAHTQLLVPQAVAGYADTPSIMRISYRSGEALPGAAFAAQQTRRVDEVSFARDYALSAENLTLYRLGTGGRLPVASLLVPIVVGAQVLGILLLDNFNTIGAFTAEDEALLFHLAQQVGLALENVRLMQATQERAGQLEALNAAAAALAANLRTDHLAGALLDQLPSVLPYDMATLWLRSGDRLGVAAARGFPDIEQRLGLTIGVKESQLFEEIARGGRPIAVDDVRTDGRFPRAEVPRLSWLGVPLLSKGALIGVLTMEKWQANFYRADKIQIGLAFASQVAISFENARLYEESLRRSAELDERSQRLALLNRFSGALGGLLDADQILKLTAEETLQALRIKRVSVVVPEGGNAVWKLATPAADLDLPRVLPKTDLLTRLQASKEVFLSLDASAEPELAPLAEMLVDTGGLLIVPVATGPDLHALLLAHVFGDVRLGATEIELARTLANQAAIALENARLYHATLQTAERLAILNDAGAHVSARLDPEAIFDAAYTAARRLLPADGFLVSLRDESTGQIEDVFVMDGDARVPVRRVASQKGIVGKVISTGLPTLLSGREQVRAAAAPNEAVNRQVLSILAVPMSVGGRTLGSLVAQCYRDGAYTQEDQQILGTLANQAMVAIQNARLFEETQRLAQDLELRVVERTSQLQQEQRNTETLLGILTEVSSSLDLDRALHRTLSLLNDASGAEQGTIMLLHAADGLLHFRAGYGYLSEDGGASGRGDFTLHVGEGLAGAVIQSREPLLASDLQEDPRFRAAPEAADHRSAIAVPMIVGEDAIGVLMVFHRTAGFFGAELVNLVKAIAAQVAVAINNAHLYELIRDQAERLGVMLRSEQEGASRSQAILQAVADGVLVTGPDNRISFVNASAERILPKHVSSLAGQPLAVLKDALGQAGSAWMETIDRWRQDPASRQAGETYAEQLDLADGRIALVHVAPVVLEADFLGTVSILRDITHEVEVDRLKSEFVSTVSHELRTPMTSIKGYVDLLRGGAAGALNENQTHFLEIVGSNIDRLDGLVDDLLDISRIEAGKIVLDKQAVDLRGLAREVVARVSARSQQDQKPLSLTLDAPKNLPRVIGDAERLRQVLENLVENAYNYTPENGAIRVALRALKGGEVQVDVVDNGVGIATEDQQRAFERFYRGENPLVLAKPGTGLGLAIVQQIVQMHGGRVWLTSSGTPGQGTTASFTLPAAPRA